MEHRVLAATGRPLIAMWLDHCFRLIPDWQLQDTIAVDSAALSTESPQPRAVIVDIGDSSGNTVAFSQSIRKAWPGVQMIAVTCCRAGHDKVLRELLSMDLAGYVVCDSDAEHCASELMNALNAPRLRQLDGAAQTLKHVGDPSCSVSAMDQQLITLCARGLSFGEIARFMGLSETMVRHHLAAVKARAEAASVADLVLWAQARGLIEGTQGAAVGAGEGVVATVPLENHAF